MELVKLILHVLGLQTAGCVVVVKNVGHTVQCGVKLPGEVLDLESVLEAPLLEVVQSGVGDDSEVFVPKDGSYVSPTPNFGKLSRIREMLQKHPEKAPKFLL